MILKKEEVMKKLITFVFFLFTLTLIQAQGEWIKISNPDNNNDLHSIDVSTDYSIWFAGSYGAVLQYNGSIIIENTSFPGYNSNIHSRDILFLDENTGFVVSDDNLIFKTTDGGVSWTIVHNDGTEGVQLKAIGFWDDNNGLAVGNSGTMLKTTDGGNNWTSIEAPSSYDLNGLALCYENFTGIVGAENNILAKTTNAGTDWSITELPTYLSVEDMAMSDDYQTIYASGMSDYITKTVDQGENWTQYSVPSTLGNFILSIAISNVDHNLIAIGDEKGHVYVSYTGGEDWEDYSPVFTVEYERPINDIAFDGLDMWIVSDNGYIAKQTIITKVEPIDNNIPNEFNLAQNYPNPFNPTTTISFGLPEQSTVSLQIFDITGKVLEELLKNEYLPAGTFSYSFDAKNLSSGIYFYRITAKGSKNFTMIKKMLMLK